MKYTLLLTLFTVFNFSFGSENIKNCTIPSPQKTWEEAKQFESSKILQQVGYKLTDHEIRKHIHDIHQKSPNAYSYFCKKIEKKRNQTQENLSKNLYTIANDLGVEEFKSTLATIKKDTVTHSGTITLVGLEQFPVAIQQSIQTFVSDHKNNLLPHKINFVSYNRYTAQYQNNESIITAPINDDEMTSKISLNHELGHLCDNQLTSGGELAALYRNMSLWYADEHFKKQKNKTVSMWVNLLDKFESNYKCTGLFVKICQSREILADALATNNNKQMAKIGYVDYSKNTYPKNTYFDSFSHPALSVRVHQMVSLYRYYKIEQKMAKEYGFMGYQHGNLFN